MAFLSRAAGLDRSAGLRFGICTRIECSEGNRSHYPGSDPAQLLAFQNHQGRELDVQISWQVVRKRFSHQSSKSLVHALALASSSIQFGRSYFNCY